MAEGSHDVRQKKLTWIKDAAFFSSQNQFALFSL